MDGTAQEEPRNSTQATRGAGSEKSWIPGLDLGSSESVRQKKKIWILGSLAY